MRTVGSSGHLWSYEFHEARHSKARDEFTRHGFLPSRVTLTHRNVCKEGFTIEDTADALFLDIPAPWDAIDHAKRALKKDRITRICCFSPCMEQVMRTVSALNDAGFTGCSVKWVQIISVEIVPFLSVYLAPESHRRLFTDAFSLFLLGFGLEITMYETLLRPHEVSSAPPLVSINEIGEKIKQSEARREEKRLKQIAQGHRGGSGAGKKGKRKHEEDEVPIEGDPEAKRAKTEDADDEGPNGSTAVVMSEPKQEEDVEMTAIALESATSTSAPTPQAQVENTSTTKQPSRPQRKRNMVGDPSAVTLSRVMPEEDDGDNGKESGPKPQSGASAADAEMTVAA
ncbi:tRNA (adenine-N(1)-)-methyltransferase catalytic subunit trm61 [Marasmius sp. AFHP31]|nr:tRNA (adenine-N(1)-)-methyltransferase catalytic subunit trm61 [Marasmius sp. AFHP31]